MYELRLKLYLHTWSDRVLLTISIVIVPEFHTNSNFTTPSIQVIVSGEEYVTIIS